MNWCVELPAQSGAQRLLTAVLRASTRLVFAIGMHPRLSPATQRRVLRLATLVAPRACGVSIEAGRLAGVPCEWLRPARDNGWVVLYLHGGAFMVGSPKTHRAITSHLAVQSGAQVCALDYRLAPEHPWPAAAEDALAAYLALLERGQPAARIALVGDSAGGQLTLATALRLRDQGLPLPAALVCLSPVTDLTGNTWHEPRGGDPLLSRAWLEQGLDAYCPVGTDRWAAPLSPLYADLSGLPPLLVQVGEDEHLLSQSTCLRDCVGLDLRLEVYPGQWHVFQVNCGLLQVAAQGRRLSTGEGLPMNTILITGAASGIGAATARLFHARGWTVGLLDIDHRALAALAAELGGVWHAELNVTDSGAVREALQDFCSQHHGRLRVLFNSAGVLRFGHFEEIELEEHARILQINVFGLLQVTHAAFAYLKGTPGAQVINMGSASGLYGTPDMVSYSASKFAVRGLTEALELEWRRHGIHVGDLMPPFVATPMIDSQRFTPPALRRMGVNLRAEDIAAAVWHQVGRPQVHRPVHWLFRLMYAAGQVSPPAVSRLLMGWLSRN